MSRMIFMLVITTVSSPAFAQLAAAGSNKSTDPLQNSGLVFVPSAHDRCQNRGNFYCESSKLCISANRLCDGTSDCVFREDELGCAPASLTNITNASCGSTVYGFGTLLIPHYSETNNNPLSCKWTVIANPPTGYVILGIPSMSLESCCTFLSFSTGSDTPRLTGQLTPSGLMIFDGLVDVTFTTNRTSAASGLSLSFATMPFQNVTVVTPPCGSTLYESGYVQSPNYPGNYSNFLSCNWTIIANPSYGKIFLQIMSFNTDSCCDFLSIYSGATLMHRYSGTVGPIGYVYNENVMVLSFTTDDTSVASGFSIWFSTSVPTTESPVEACNRRGYFYCATSDQCVEKKHRCDGYSFCNSGEDEAGCSSSSRIDSRYSHGCLLVGYALARIIFP